MFLLRFSVSEHARNLGPFFFSLLLGHSGKLFFYHYCITEPISQPTHFNLQKEAVYPSEISLSPYKTTWCHNLNFVICLNTSG
jgi:hypothetical protein